MGIFFLSTIPFLIPAPTAFANIGWKYYMLFIGLTVINVGIIAWKFPEVNIHVRAGDVLSLTTSKTKGLALEEINALFGDEVVVDLTHMTTEARAEFDRKIAVEAIHAENELDNEVKVGHAESDK